MGCDLISLLLVKSFFFPPRRHVMRRGERGVEKSAPALSGQCLWKLEGKLIGERVENKVKIRALSVELKLDGQGMRLP